MGPEILRLKNIRQIYGSGKNSVNVLNGIDLKIEEGVFHGIIGPNGSGKSTLLKIMALINPPTSGEIYYRGVKIQWKNGKKDILAIRRKFGFIRQKPVVLDTDVYKNLIYPLKFRKIPERIIKEKAEEFGKKFRLTHLFGRRATSLSGGEMQRLVIAISLITGPELLFMDEVFSNLDGENTALMEEIFSELRENGRTTVVFTTHDAGEAIKFADSLTVLNKGHITATGNIESVLSAPKDGFTAKFMGYSNVIEGYGEYNEDEKITELFLDDLKLFCTEKAEGRVSVCIRPSGITLYTQRPQNSSLRNIIKGKIIDLRKLINEVYVRVKAGKNIFVASVSYGSAAKMGLSAGKRIYMGIKATDIHLITE